MGISKSRLSSIEDIFIDYPFEDVMYRWDSKNKKVHVKFYGKEESKNEVSHDNRLFNDALLFGNEITKDEYAAGKKNRLDMAIQIATQAHSGQFDKGGQPYILHPLRVMFQFDSEKERIVAVLHDVIEDSNITLNEIKGNGFSDEIIEALDCLSRRQDENYDEFIDRVLTNQLACMIKIEDIKDNLNVTRLNNIKEKDLKRLYKYHQALSRLIKHARK
ncbi:GTP pyrophosphokinase [Vibrio aerogenes CECT 7868]|uniref:GTP pyrophosphokinase n=1 Tax=Vibrio aerogenes CECT 7868 TaxID=1216006 RepID=A0A1M5XDJ4_9VIBR|nr:hypothetical protein [Vibrio aerogenes]SHH97891.1 GTP pyrophosphokinase [Vibrio aerogenes CECT 7868]